MQGSLEADCQKRPRKAVFGTPASFLACPWIESGNICEESGAQEFPFLSRLNSEFVSWKRSSYDPGHNMGLGTKNRQKQTADICKQHLREKYPDKLGLVEEFIVEFEGGPQRLRYHSLGPLHRYKRH